MPRLSFLTWRSRPLHILCLLMVGLFISHRLLDRRRDVKNDDLDLQHRYPLLWAHVHTSGGTGGAWYIPSEWTSGSKHQPQNIVDAAVIASRAALSDNTRTMTHSSIPLVLHQTWKNTNIDTWSDDIRGVTEKWLEYVVSNNMAYVLWDDVGINQVLEDHEWSKNEIWPSSDETSVLTFIERTDVFRILLCSLFGGIYADTDTYPLRPPATWIAPSDLEPWNDPDTMFTYNSTEPVKLILGIEGDFPIDTDEYCRQGFYYPVQVTQWTLASAPQHPVLLDYMMNLSRSLQQVANENGFDLSSESTREQVRQIDPIVLTGPAAMTSAAMSWLESNAGLRWNALTGVNGDGRSKLAHDVLIFPITAFNPGRSSEGHKLSKSIEDSSARVFHLSQGSWKHFSPMVFVALACRNLLGLCKDWNISKAG